MEALLMEGLHYLDQFELEESLLELELLEETWLEELELEESLLELLEMDESEDWIEESEDEDSEELRLEDITHS
jgi:hypothetical protein